MKLFLKLTLGAEICSLFKVVNKLLINIKKYSTLVQWCKKLIQSTFTNNSMLAIFLSNSEKPSNESYMRYLDENTQCIRIGLFLMTLH